MCKIDLHVCLVVFSFVIWSGQTLMSCNMSVKLSIRPMRFIVGFCWNFHYIFVSTMPSKAIKWWQAIELHMYTKLLINRRLSIHYLWPYSSRLFCLHKFLDMRLKCIWVLHFLNHVFWLNSSLFLKTFMLHGMNILNLINTWENDKSTMKNIDSMKNV